MQNPFSHAVEYMLFVFGGYSELEIEICSHTRLFFFGKLCFFSSSKAGGVQDTVESIMIGDSEKPKNFHLYDEPNS